MPLTKDYTDFKTKATFSKALKHLRRQINK